MKLFDSHCHLQDPRIYAISPQKITIALDAGVVHIAVNGVSEKDRTSDWLNILKEFLQSTPEAAVGEIGLDKAPWASHIDYATQVEVFQKQLQLAQASINSLS